MNDASNARHLIVNADDFGLSPGINQGIVQAHEQGIVTSASLMVRGPVAAEAAACARRHPRLSVGLHADLGEWVFADGEWRVAYEVVRADDAAAVEAELARQLVAFRRLMGRDPTHLDSHQHAHGSEPARTVFRRAARQLGIVLRHFDPEIRYCGEFYGQSNKGDPYPEGISVDALLRLLDRLPPGCTEMGCHPATVADVDSVYREERVTECRALCDPRVRAAIVAGEIALCGFPERRLASPNNSRLD